MKDRPYLSRIAILALVSLVAGCVIAADVTVWVRPQWFDTHQEAISYILDRQGIAYEEVKVQQVWPDTLDREAYAADVVVLRAGASQAIGRIVCASGRSGCYLRVRALGITHE